MNSGSKTPPQIEAWKNGSQQTDWRLAPGTLGPRSAWHWTGPRGIIPYNQRYQRNFLAKNTFRLWKLAIYTVVDSMIILEAKNSGMMDVSVPAIGEELMIIVLKDIVDK